MLLISVRLSEIMKIIDERERNKDTYRKKQKACASYRESQRMLRWSVDV